MKHLESLWFTGAGVTIGIILVEGEGAHEDFAPGERGAYIGVGDGASEHWDARKILQIGAPFRADTFAQLVRHFTNHPGPAL
jgi:hypothetical protein